MRRGNTPPITVRSARPDDAERFLAGDPREPWEVLLAWDRGEREVGLAELSVRPYAEGCRTRRVAYLEGWFVSPGVRGRGIGAALVAAAEFMTSNRSDQSV